MQKIIFMGAFFLFPTLLLAEVPSAEMVKIVNAVLMGPKVASKLSANNSTTLYDYSISEEEGINTYQLRFRNRPCRCRSTGAVVKITEDMRPTYHDGAPTYKAVVITK